MSRVTRLRTEEKHDVDDDFEDVVEDHGGLGHEGQLVRDEDAHVQEEHQDQEVPDHVELRVLVNDELLFLDAHLLGQVVFQKEHFQAAFPRSQGPTPKARCFPAWTSG